VPKTPEYVALCILCRSQFTDDAIKGFEACPTCNSRNVPADPRKKSTLTLTYQELRVLFIFASNWEERSVNKSDPNADPRSTISAIATAVKLQDPNLPALSLDEEIKDVANHFKADIEVVKDGERSTVKPDTTH